MSEIFPTDGSLVKVYHPVTEIDVVINGKSIIETLRSNLTESATGSKTGSDPVFHVMNGTRLEIQCQADGYPLPTYQSPQGIRSSLLKHFDRGHMRSNFDMTAECLNLHIAKSSRSN